MKILEDIYFIQGHGLNSNVYAFFSENNVSIVDTGLPNNFDYIIAELKRASSSQSINIEKIVLTHEHFDHIGAVNMFLYSFSPQVTSSLWTAKAINSRNTSIILSNLFDPFQINFKITDILTDGDTLMLGSYKFKVLHTPGHTIGSISLYSEEEKILISGDTVFANGFFGRFDLPTGNYSALKQSLAKLAKLDVDTLLPGHGPPVLKDGDLAIKLAYERLTSQI